MQKSHTVNITQETGTHAYLYKNQLYSKMTYTRILATHNYLCNNQTRGAAATAATRRLSPPLDRITMPRNPSGTGTEPVGPAKTTNKQ